jgi:hypothetical protein
LFVYIGVSRYTFLSAADRILINVMAPAMPHKNRADLGNFFD